MSDTNSAPEYILKLSAKDQPGVIAGVAGALAGKGCNIKEMAQFSDPESGRMFQRIVFVGNVDEARTALDAVKQQFHADYSIRDASERRKVVLMVSKFDHCLGDLLYRNRIGELNMDVVAIIGNHPKEALNITLIGDTPYHYLPVTKETKPQQEAQIKQIVTETGAELVVLARYMQILSDDLAAFLSHRCINIHHSFLPGFKGAKPYHQAFARGVKMIGATTHYVTADLDEGPIIHQDVETVTHADQPETLVAKGRDVERRVLAEGVRLHLQERTFVIGNKTIVFK
ncbi:MAG: formyltetrahydrofolate deformylase [Sphingobium sp. 66-54]|nr:MAG: formyltetrahydrofolate deformylase [Sphingobium sp. 66-54]